MYADVIAVCPVNFDSAKYFSRILSFYLFLKSIFTYPIHKIRPYNKCKQVSSGICIYGVVYIHSCLFFFFFTYEKKELLYITLSIAVVLLNDFTALNSSYILQYSTMYIIYNELLVYGNKTRNQKLKKEVYARKVIKLLLFDDFFFFIFCVLLRFTS